MEVKKNELFRPALKTFISAAYDPDLMSQYTDYLKFKVPFLDSWSNEVHLPKKFTLISRLKSFEI